MWDFLLGELGLAPAVARGLDWLEVDHYYHGYEARRQKALEGHRVTANLIYNALADKPLKPAQFLSLPAVDGVVSIGLSPEKLEELKQMRDRLAAQNARKLAEKAVL